MVFQLHTGGSRRFSLEKRKRLLQSTWLAAATWTGSATTYVVNNSLCVSVFLFTKIQSRRKSSHLPRRCGQLPLTPSFRRKISSFLISFIEIRVGVDHPSSSRFFCAMVGSTLCSEYKHLWPHLISCIFSKGKPLK